MCPYTPLLCAKFRGNQILCTNFMAVFVSVRKGEERKKTKKLSQFLKCHISGMLEAILLKFATVYGVLTLTGMSTAKIVAYYKGSMELQMSENCVFFPPVNILRCCMPASWATRHATVCLDAIQISLFLFKFKLLVCLPC